MLLPPGTFTAQVVAVQEMDSCVQIGFQTSDEKTAFQRIPLSQWRHGLETMGCRDAKEVMGRSCAIRVERVSSGPGIELARVVVECPPKIGRI